MEQGLKDSIVTAALAGDVANVGEKLDMDLQPLNAEQQKEKMAEYEKLFPKAKDDLISVLEVLRDMPGSKFNFQITDKGIKTNVILGINDADLMGPLTILLKPAQIISPTYTKTTVEPPFMQVVIAHQAGNSVGIVTKPTFFLNERQAEKAIAMMTTVITRYAEREDARKLADLNDRELILAGVQKPPAKQNSDRPSDLPPFSAR